MRKIYSKMKLLLLGVFASVYLCACGSVNNTVGENPKDYLSAEEIETDLNTDINVNGSTALVEIKSIAPDSKFGFNVMAGEHLNFIIEKNDEVAEGDICRFKVNGTKEFLGTWILYSEFIEKVEVEDLSEESEIAEVEENQFDENLDSDDENQIEDDAVEEKTIDIESVENEKVDSHDEIKTTHDLNDEELVETPAEETVEEIVPETPVVVENPSVEEAVVEETIITPVDNATTITTGSGQYIGNVNNGKLHLAGCSGLPYEKNRVYFDTREEAIAAGYSDPCQRCNP